MRHTNFLLGLFLLVFLHDGVAQSGTNIPPAIPTSKPVVSDTGLVVEGQRLELSAGVADASHVTFQWLKDGLPLPGQTSNNFVRSAATVADVGAYSVVATKAGSSETSETRAVTLSFPARPIINVSPSPQLVTMGGNAFLSVSATGAGLGYQWRRNGIAVPGATSSSYSFVPNANSGAADAYAVLVSNSQGSALSDSAVVSVAPPAAPIIHIHPSSRAVRQGEGVNLEVGAFGGSNSQTYEWRKDGLPLPDAASVYYYSKYGATPADAGAYSVIVGNGGGTATSVTAQVTILPGAPPVILQDPPSMSLRLGFVYGGYYASASSGVVATYQWLKDGSPIPGATKSDYFLNGSDASSAGAYALVVSNAFGSVTSNPGIVTIDQIPPAITYVPGGVALPIGEPGELSITTGATPAAVQWRKDGVPIPGATSSTLSLGKVSLSTAGSYVAAVTIGGLLPVDSRPITVRIRDLGRAPLIVVHPRAQARTGFAEFTVSAEGEGALAYQWRKDGVPISGATSASYYIGSLVDTQAGNYSVVVSNRHGTVVSENARLTVLSPLLATPKILIDLPGSLVLFSHGSSYSLGVKTDQTSGVSYQWWKDGLAILGRNSSSQPVSTDFSSAGRYAVVVSNPAGTVTSKECVVTVLDYPPAPRFASHPLSAAVLPGTTVTLKPEVKSPVPVTFRWRKNGVDLAGATASSLNISNTQIADAGSYTVIASSVEGVASSNAAILTVQTPPVGKPLITAEPLSVVVVSGSGYTLTAGVAANPAATYQWFRDGQPVEGAISSVLVLASVTSSSSYQLVATNSLGTATTRTVVIAPGEPINFGAAPLSRTVVAGSSLTLSVPVSGGAALTYQWKKNGVDLASATNAILVVPAVRLVDAGNYSLVATNSSGSAESSATPVTVTPSPHAGAYYGHFSSYDAFAFFVGTDAVGSLIGRLSSRGRAVVALGVVVKPDGTFSSEGINGASPSVFAAVRTVTGTILGSGMSGSLPTEGETFSGSMRPRTGVGSGVTGYYYAVSVTAALAELHIIAAADGDLQVVGLDPTGSRFAWGRTVADGTFTAAVPQFTYTGKLGVNGAPFSATFQKANTPAVAFASPASVGGPERLANVSARGLAGSDSSALIAGFVVSGTAPKDVLIRGVGPALTGFGVAGALANPRLKLFKGNTSLLENDDWGLGGFATQIASTTARVGGFPFTAGSQDAALIARLDPGSYSAQVTGATSATGVALVEVYDAADTLNATRLINLSTRGEVGTGGDILIVGVVVTGNAPKKILLRGVGPGLAAFGVPGTLVDPQLKLFRGSQLVAENDNWSTGADAALIADAAVAVGAFALPAASKDAALLLYLAPGTYSAQLSGAGSTTGVGLVEAYEVP